MLRLHFPFFNSGKRRDNQIGSCSGKLILKAGCPAEATHHIRMDRILDAQGNHIPTDTPYAVLVESTCPVVVQYSRLDTALGKEALMTTIAYPVEE